MQSGYDRKWVETEKEVDPQFEGSISQALGLTDKLCPTCHAHLGETDDGELICLNGCHMELQYRELFDALIKLMGGGRNE